MLAWVMNMGFAASDAGAVAPTVTSLSTLIILGTCLSLAVTFLG